MNTVLGIGLVITLFYLIIQFARQEYVQDEYEEAIFDVEGRLEWACTRTFFPFGMKAQIEVSNELLGESKSLWRENKWHRAYRVALESQKAMNQAQRIYGWAIKTRR